MNLALTDFLTTHLGSGWQLEPLRTGEVNQGWKVTTATRCYFLKQQGNAAHNSINRVAEVRLQQALSVSQLSPTVVAHSHDYSWVLMHWVEEPTLESLASDEQLRVLATTLTRIHQQTPELPSWSLETRLHNYLTAVQHYQPQVARHFQQQLLPYQSLIDAWDKGPRTFCHNDLSVQHILLTEPIQVVDWEYAGYGHPWFDVASAAAINKLQPHQQSELCVHYTKASGVALKPEQLTPWRDLLTVINDLWFCAQRRPV